jgi:hypothetical protein
VASWISFRPIWPTIHNYPWPNSGAQTPGTADAGIDRTLKAGNNVENRDADPMKVADTLY